MIDPTNEEPLVTLEQLEQATDALVAPSTASDVEPLGSGTGRADIGVRRDGEGLTLQTYDYMNRVSVTGFMHFTDVQTMTDQQRDELQTVDEVLQVSRRRRVTEMGA